MEQGSAVTERREARSPRDYTPPHLVERILTTRSALVGERKQVTVLFADVQGSVALSAALDAEEWHEILDEFFETLTAGVHRFDGTVNQYTGDGIMAIFGAPLALEDHAQRACHAALELRDRLRTQAHRLRVERGTDMRIRLALHSGEVVVGAIGDDLRMDYTAQGFTVGLAARIQEVTAPERVYVSERTASLVSGWFELRDLGRTSLKGIDESVRLFELESATLPRTRLEVARGRGFTPFVGRGEEIAVLEAAMVRSADAGQIVGVVGEAGVGKSRLCLEFARVLAARDVAIYSAACPSHASTLPLFLLRELLRSLLAVERDAGPGEETTAKITRCLQSLDPGLEREIGLLLELLQLPDANRPPPVIDAEAKRRLIIETLRRLLVARTREAPALILLDDLHWIDGESDALLEELVEGIPDSRALLVANFRPEYQATWMRRSSYQQLGLNPMAADRTRELVRALLGTDSSLEALAERLYEATRGNPFFVEEVVQGLVERGALTGEPGHYRLADTDAVLAIPSTVQSVLAARIDRLSASDKDVLSAAAVAGRRFSAALVARVVGLGSDALVTSLDALCAAELLRREHTHPDPEYAFRHPLTHEVAYASQLRVSRRRLHAALAWVLAEADVRSEEHASLVGHHLERAGEPLEAARWRWRAVEAIGWSDAAALLPHLRHVMRLTDALPDDPQATRLGIHARTRGVAEGLLSNCGLEEGTRWFRDGTAAAERLGHLPAVATLHGWYANLLGGHDRRELAGVHAEEALRLARKSGSPRALIGISYGVLQELSAHGRFEEALSFADEVISAARGESREIEAVVAAHALLARAELLVATGRLREAIEQANEIRGKPSIWHHPQVSVGEAQVRADAHFFLGDFEGQLKAARQSLERADAWRNRGAQGAARRHIGHALLGLGRPAESLEVLGTAVPIEASKPQHGWSGLLEIQLAHALVALGRKTEGLAAVDAGLGMMQGWRRADFELWFFHHLLDVLLLADPRGQARRVEETLERFERRVRDSGAASFRPQVSIARARLAEAHGDTDAGAELRGQAADELRAMGAQLAAELALAR